MTRRKTLKELTIKDNFMFGAVMCNEDLCRQLLELILGFSIERVEVSKEKCMVYHPEYKGIRLDVYARDVNNTHYNVEMQALADPALGRRARYYHIQIDMDLLNTGRDYEELPNAYVIFICDFDPFGYGKYRYAFRRQCIGFSDFELADGSETIFLSTKGCDDRDVCPELVKFLDYVGANLEESTSDFKDEFVEKLQKKVSDIKLSRRMEERYMLTELLMRDERRAGRAEGRIEGLKRSILVLLDGFGTLPEELKNKIEQEMVQEQVEQWIKLAASVDSIEQFIKEM